MSASSRFSTATELACGPSMWNIGFRLFLATYVLWSEQNLYVLEFIFFFHDDCLSKYNAWSVCIEGYPRGVDRGHCGGLEPFELDGAIGGSRMGSTGIGWEWAFSLKFISLPASWLSRYQSFDWVRVLILNCFKSTFSPKFGFDGEWRNCAFFITVCAVIAFNCERGQCYTVEVCLVYIHM